MYLLYLDDSGSVPNRNEDHIVLGGLSVFERQIHWIIKEMDQLASSMAPSNPNAIEFHASEIFSGRIDPWKGMTKDERIEIMLKVLHIMAKSHASTTAFACAVHKDSFPSRDPMEIAFEQLCNRFDRYLSRIYKGGENHRGMIILDECSYESSLRNLAFGYRERGTRWGVIKNLPEVPMFVDSKASRLVQLADHIAYAVFRRYEAKDSKYLDAIKSRFDFENKVLHGLVHKQTVDPACMCSACISRQT